MDSYLIEKVEPHPVLPPPQNVVRWLLDLGWLRGGNTLKFVLLLKLLLQDLHVLRILLLLRGLDPDSLFDLWTAVAVFPLTDAPLLPQPGHVVYWSAGGVRLA